MCVKMNDGEVVIVVINVLAVKLFFIALRKTFSGESESKYIAEYNLLLTQVRQP